MNRIILGFVLALTLLFTGCGMEATTVTSYSGQNDGQNEAYNEDEISFTYTADFYDNYGNRFFSVEGKDISIKPNKIKVGGWNSDGVWTAFYEMSSVMSISIDGHEIESCGSSVIFADTQLEKCDIDFDNSVTTKNAAEEELSASISQPSDIRIEDWWKIQFWWSQKTLNNENTGSRLVIVQSQLGNPICAYMGEEVSWDIPKNLPKTTQIMIDDKVLYIHRANFCIIDTELISMISLPE